MPTLDLTDDEARVLVHLLDEAGREYSNHGCNDFDLRSELGLDQERAIAMAHSLRVSMVEHQVADEDYAEDTKSPYLMDWMLFVLFEAKVRALLQGGSGEGGPGGAPQGRG